VCAGQFDFDNTWDMSMLTECHSVGISLIYPELNLFSQGK